MLRSRCTVSTSTAITFVSLFTSAAAQLPVTGRPVSELAWLDTEVLDLMNEFAVSGGMVAMMRNGRIIYQRGFGWHDSGENVAMPENALARIASCTKPITAAAIQRLVSENRLELDDFAFDLGQPGGGILQLTPFPSLGDEELKEVTVLHLLTHMGGWDRDPALGVGDLTYNECTIAGDMGVPTPPGRTNTMRWILGQPLQFTPGTDQAYSNIGFLALGLIVEQVTGQGLTTYLRDNILTPDDWVPATDFRQGRTFEVNQPPREAWYDGNDLEHCVFNNSECSFGCSTVIFNSAYGAWDHEARISQGGTVLSPATMLRFLDRYYVESFDPEIGEPLNGGRLNGDHGGVQDGCNAYAWQRDDGINVFMFFNEDAANDDPDDPGHFGRLLRSRIEATIDDQTNWPTFDVEGFWATPSVGTPAAYGSYDRPFRGMPDALSTLEHGSILNLKAGTYAFSGTISTQLKLRAPLGLARIGG